MEYPYPENGDFRRQAREALKPNLTTALMIAFLASLPGMIASTMRSMATGPVFQGIITLLLQYNADKNMSELVLLNRLGKLLSEGISQQMLTATAIVSVVAVLITPALELGLRASILNMLRKEPVTAASVLSRMRSFLKAIVLRLYILLRLLLWMLPGIAVCALSIPVLFQFKSIEVFNTMYFAGMVVMMVLGLRAALHYAQADWLLADNPAARIRDCVHDSVLIMRRRKKLLVLLYCSFIGWMLLTNVASNLLMGINNVLGYVSDMAFSLGLNLYMCAAAGAFYEHYNKQPLQM